MTYPKKNDILIPSTTRFGEIGNLLLIVREVNEEDDELVAENIQTNERVSIKIDGVLYLGEKEFDNLRDRLPKAKWYNDIFLEFSNFRKMLIYSATLNSFGVIIIYLDYLLIFKDIHSYGLGSCFIGTFLLVMTLLVFKKFGNNFIKKDG
jgi:hypothetical protein